MEPQIQNHSLRNSLVGLVLILVVVGGGYMLYEKFSPKKQSFTSENVIVTTVDPKEKEGAEKLPVGFPTDIPVELENITVSEALDYPDRKAAVYSVAYLSLKQMEELGTIYNNFLTKGGYTITQANKSVDRRIYTATKGKDDINIMITPQAGQMNVLVSYAHRE